MKTTITPAARARLDRLIDFRCRVRDLAACHGLPEVADDATLLEWLRRSLQELGVLRRVTLSLRRAESE